ncbi:MAG: 6-phosphogluconolactonase [Planctomycetota bacterium]|jgi:6-phosphogluconolactonase
MTALLNPSGNSSKVECWVARDANQLAQLACKVLLQTLTPPDEAAKPDRNPTPSPLPAVALSGGTTPLKLYEFITFVESSNPIWQQVEWFWSDERNVPLDDCDSNYGVARQYFLQPLQIPNERIHPVPIQIKNPVNAAADYEAEIRKMIPETRKGQPVFRAIFLGLGDDAHTASLFPDTDALREKNRSVVSNHVHKLATDRITFTAPLINAADNVIFLVSGAKKRDALQQIWHGKNNPELYPAQLIKGVRRLIWIVDSRAIGETPPPVNAITTVF